MLDSMDFFFTLADMTLVQSGKDVILAPERDSGNFSLTLRNVSLEQLQDWMITEEIILDAGQETSSKPVVSAPEWPALFEPADPPPLPDLSHDGGYAPDETVLEFIDLPALDWYLIIWPDYLA